MIERKSKNINDNKANTNNNKKKKSPTQVPSFNKLGINNVLLFLAGCME